MYNNLFATLKKIEMRTDLESFRSQVIIETTGLADPAPVVGYLQHWGELPERLQRNPHK